MIREVFMVVGLSILSQLLLRAYNYYDFMGYGRRIDEPTSVSICASKFGNLTSDDGHGHFKVPIFNTLDADMLPNGLCLFVSGHTYPFNHLTLQSSQSFQVPTNVFMLDLNYLAEPDSSPFAIQIEANDSTTQNLNEYFNLFAVSIYEHSTGLVTLLAANWITDKMRQAHPFVYKEGKYSIEKFVFDGNKHRLIHTNRFPQGLSQGHLCDLVALDDNLFYFTKCFGSESEAEWPRKIKTYLEWPDGEIWLCDLNTDQVYQVAKGLFMPKALAYLRYKEILVVTNWRGISLFKKEFDHSLTKIRDIELNTFVFDIFAVGLSNHLYLTSHPYLYQTLDLSSSSNNNLEQSVTFTASEFIEMHLDLRYSQRVNFEKRTLFATNGSSDLQMAAMSSGLSYKNSFILFSLFSDPLVCTQNKLLKK